MKRERYIAIFMEIISLAMIGGLVYLYREFSRFWKLTVLERKCYRNLTCRVVFV